MSAYWATPQPRNVRTTPRLNELAESRADDGRYSWIKWELPELDGCCGVYAKIAFWIRWLTRLSKYLLVSVISFLVEVCASDIVTVTASSRWNIERFSVLNSWRWASSDSAQARWFVMDVLMVSTFPVISVRDYTTVWSYKVLWQVFYIHQNRRY